MADWMPVYGSSTVTKIKYHEGTQEVYVEFRGGEIYVYRGVPLEVWDQLIHAGSKGKFVNIVLRRGYKYSKVSAPADDQGGKGGS